MGKRMGKSMDKKEIIKKVMQKPELKELPIEDVELAFSLCFKKGYSDNEQIKCTREILHRAYGAFGSRKLLSSCKRGQTREPEWILRKHLSTRERLPHYNKIYERILGDRNKNKLTIFDLGAGVNGFSLSFLPKVKYMGVEGIGQLVSLMNNYFKKQKFNARAIHLSLFNLEKIKNLIKRGAGKKIIFLFKVLDSLEALERDYSKKFLKEVTPLADKVVISFATRSMLSKKPFKVKRNWIMNFIRDNFRITDDFEIGGERYICFAKK